MREEEMHGEVNQDIVNNKEEIQDGFPFPSIIMTLLTFPHQSRFLFV
jgi:hypothetical protein